MFITPIVCFLNFLVVKICSVYIFVPSQNATTTCTVWSVKNCAVTVATGNRVITWTEPVHTDVTRGFTERNVIKVMLGSSSINNN